MHHVHKEKQICEVLLDFLFLERITGECIGQTTLKFYEEKGVDILIFQSMTVLWWCSYYAITKNGGGSYILKESSKAQLMLLMHSKMNFDKEYDVVFQRRVAYGRSTKSWT